MRAAIVAARSEWRLFGDVVFALLVRELKSRYGNYRMGYAWALLEPLFTISLFCFVFGLKQQQLFGDVEAPVFIAAGYLPFLLFRNCCSRLQKAVSANINLFCFRQITPFTTLVTRYFLECLISLATLIVLLAALLWLGFNAMPADPLGLLAGIFLLSLLGFAIGTIFCIVVSLFAEAEKLVSMLMRPLVWISCVYHPLAVVPQEYRHFLLWNPLVHGLELIRNSWIANYPQAGASWFYLSACTLVSLALALSGYRLFHQRLVSSS